MIESFNFEYKRTRMFHDIQPAGMSIYGERGANGRDGLSGSTVYFIKYSTISDALKEELLMDINNSTDINGSGKTTIYHDNDLIICEISVNVYNYIYRIVKTNNTSKPYDIERIGYIKSDTNITDVLDSIHSVKITVGKPSKTKCHVPVNRSFEYSRADNLTYKNGKGTENYGESGRSDYKDALRLLFGFNVTPEITLTDEANANNYDFYLKIHIKNKKSLLGRNEFPIYSTSGNENVLFEKIIEIPVSKLYMSDSSIVDIERKTPYFISDMACDKLHPSFNNYSSSFFDSYRNNGFISNVIDTNDIKYPFHLFAFQNVQDYSCIGGNIKQNIDASIFEAIQDCCNSPYIGYTQLQSSTMIHYSGHSEDQTIQYRSGESAYFSGMVSDKKFNSDCFVSNASSYTKNISSLYDVTYDQYVATQRSLNEKLDLDSEYGDGNTQTYVNKRINTVMEYVYSKMYDFIFNTDNVFELICVDNRTGYTKIKVLSLEDIIQKETN